MPRARTNPLFGALNHPFFWASSAGGVGLMVLALIGAPALVLAVVGSGLAIIIGLIGAWVDYSRHNTVPEEKSTVPPELVGSTDLIRVYHFLSEALVSVATQPDSHLKNVLTQKLVALGVQFRSMATGTSTFAGTASWHVAHDAILAVPDLTEYRSVIWVRTAEYTREMTTQESVRAVIAAAHRGVFVERVFVLPDSLWPVDQLFPTAIRPWIEEQHNHGLRVILLRARDIAGGAVDTCVFGDWGVGTRDLDDQSETVRVHLEFDPVAVRTALERLDRLSDSGIPFGDLLDRAAQDG